MAHAIIPHCDTIISWFLYYATTNTLTTTTYTTTAMTNTTTNITHNIKKRNKLLHILGSSNYSDRKSTDITYKRNVKRNDSDNKVVNIGDNSVHKPKQLSENRRVKFVFETRNDSCIDDVNDGVDDNMAGGGDHDVDGDDSDSNTVLDDRYDLVIEDPDMLGMTFKGCSKFAHDVGLVPYIFKEMQYYG